MAQQLIDVARQALALGLHVFPLKPRSKHPATAHGFKNSSADPETITAWWTSNPEYNIGIDCGASGITVLDIDAGLESLTDLDTWFEATGLAPTYTVRTGRRTSYGVQMYFRGTMPSSGAKKWSLNGCTGEIKSLGGYVVGAGSIHPDSGQRYRVICDQPLTDLPDIVRDGVSTKKESPPGREPSTGKIPPGTWHNLLVSFAGTVFNAGVTSADGLYRAMLVYARENFDLEAQPLDKEHVAQIARNAAVTFEAKPEAGVAEDWEAIAEPKPEPTIDLEEPAKAGDILAIFPKAKELKYPELRFPYEAMSPGRFKDLVDKACEGGLDPGLVAPAIMGLASAVPYTDRMDGDRINFMVCLLGMVGSGKDMAINRGLAVLGMESYEGKVYKFYTPSGERNIPLQLCNRPGTKTEPAKAGPARFVFVTPELEETLKKSKAETSGVLQSMQYFYDHNNKSITGRHDETLEVNCRLSWVTALPVGNVEIDTAKFRRAWGEDCSHGMASRMILGFSETSIDPRKSRNWAVPYEFNHFTTSETKETDYTGPVDVVTNDSIYSQLFKAVVKGFAPGVEEQFLDWEPKEDLSGRDRQHVHKVAILVTLLYGHTCIEQSDWDFTLAFMNWQHAIRKMFSTGIALQLKQAEFNEIVVNKIVARVKRLKETGKADKFTKIVELPNGDKRYYVLVSKVSNENNWYAHGMDVKKTIAQVVGCGTLDYLVESEFDPQGRETVKTSEAWVRVTNLQKWLK